MNKNPISDSETEREAISCSSCCYVCLLCLFVCVCFIFIYLANFCKEEREFGRLCFDLLCGRLAQTLPIHTNTKTKTRTKTGSWYITKQTGTHTVWLLVSWLLSCLLIGFSLGLPNICWPLCVRYAQMPHLD